MVYIKLTDQPMEQPPHLQYFLVTGKSEEEHLYKQDNILQRLEDFGIRAQKEKCNYFVERLECLGHLIDFKGLHPTTKKINTIKNGTIPKDVSQLRYFLGLVNYY